ncbi:ultraviolet-B receptor UVR8-like [Malus sylvestris]|uniref:ultraviolet-B receptor UVR8-like n=1 Tax=Malus sylvestris TaxID=3752 RepID=UPI0021AD4745|nr:ultraviolet-B receptor UVR8-like [Malus sylvestris]
MEEEHVTPPNGDNLSQKVVAVAAGEAHTLALTGDGFVYSWGRGMFGRLGTGSESDELAPVRIKFNDPRSEEGARLKFVGVAAGAYHSLALAEDGSVWCWGHNKYGQLGVTGENSLVPILLEQFLEVASATESDVPLKVCSVKAGGMMSLAIDSIGVLWVWGNFPHESSSNEGGFSLISSCTPTPVWDFYGHVVVRVACGNEHVVALVSAGETYKGEDLVCFSWGGNGHGQLGLGDKESRNRPQIVELFDHDSPFAVYEVVCGAFHTALLTHRKSPNDTLESMCWTFGLGENGQLGHGTTESGLSPEPVKKLPQNVYLVSVDCGLFHTSVVSSAGDVWSWGMEKGLGLCRDATFSETDSGDAISPLQINGLNGTKFQDPIQVVCGAAHTVLVANDGFKLWSWGRGRSGVLGNGKTIDCYSPAEVLWPLLTADFKQEELNTDDKRKPIADGGNRGERNLTGDAEAEM